MVNPVVYPPEAAQAGCQASYETAWTESFDEPTYTADYTYYRLKAKAAGGWRFDHFEYTQTGGTYPVEKEFVLGHVSDNGWYSYPADDTAHERQRWDALYDATNQLDPIFGDIPPTVLQVTECKAVFVPAQTGEILFGASGSVLCGASGHVLYK